MRITIFILIFLFYSCNETKTSESKKEISTTNHNINSINRFPRFSRDSILINLQEKIDNNSPLKVHAFIPLCDPKYQAIAPVYGSLGDGFDLKNNLYWGAGYGIKSYFKRKSDWKIVYDSLDYSENILERIVFYKEFDNNAKVYFIADAYRGDKMKECLEDHFNSLSELILDTVYTLTDTIPTNGNADFLVFNGHNGLMDNQINFTSIFPQKQKDAAAIACLSNYYFAMIYYPQCNAYPLVTTQSLLPPEAYVIEAIINNWAELKSGEEICNAAGDAMNNIHNCGQKAARNMFTTGWY